MQCVVHDYRYRFIAHYNANEITTYNYIISYQTYWCVCAELDNAVIGLLCNETQNGRTKSTDSEWSEHCMHGVKNSNLSSSE